VNRFVTTLQEASTAIAEQDLNLKLTKWAVKVRNTPCFVKRKDLGPPDERNVSQLAQVGNRITQF